jgi:hypothetical protein
VSKLEDLIPLGFSVYRTPEGMPPGDSVSGFDKQWIVHPGDDEGAIVAKATNHKNLSEKLVEAQTYFSNNYKNWPTMSNAQKDAAMRQSQRALTNLIRHVRGDLSTEGD